MSLLYLDGFDSYNSHADLGRRWTLESGSPAYGYTGRNGVGKAIGMAGNCKVARGLANESVVLFGFAYKSSGFDGNPPANLFQLMESSTVQCSLGFWANTAQLAFKLGSTTAIASAPRLLRKDTWYYIEGKMTVSNSLGTAGMVLQVNGETWLQVDSGDSQVTANAWADGFRFGFPDSGNNNQSLFDDFYILNASGAAPYNTFLGDIRVDTIRPNGNGTTSDFVGSDADSVDNYLHVDEVDPDGDTTYIESAVASALDLHTIESLAVTPATIFGVQPVSICKKTDAGARTGRHVLRTGATNYESADFSPSNASYLGFAEIWEENPNTTSPWVEADIDGLEFGLKVQS